MTAIQDGKRMQRQLLELTSHIDQVAGRLLGGYRPKQLHALRVGIRRIRSVLKQIGSHRSRRFRKTWGGFAAATNEARDWDVFLITSEKLLSPGEFQEFGRLALIRARLALAFALAADDERSWHKFRIAVKDVRYVADAGGTDPATDERLAEVIEACKSLQALLGNWHDAVVQLRMLDEVESSPVHTRLRSEISERKDLFLSQIRDELDRSPVFSPAS
jgi:CHAD domain-containing protein